MSLSHGLWICPCDQLFYFTQAQGVGTAGEGDSSLSVRVFWVRHLWESVALWGGSVQGPGCMEDHQPRRRTHVLQLPDPLQFIMAALANVPCPSSCLLPISVLCSISLEGADRVADAPEGAGGIG